MPSFESPGLEPLVLEGLSGQALTPWVDTQIQEWSRLRDAANGAQPGGRASEICARAISSLQDLRKTIVEDRGGRDTAKTSRQIQSGFGIAWLPNNSREFQLVERALRDYGADFVAGFLDYLLSGRVNKNGQWWKESEGKAYGLLHREMVPKGGDFALLERKQQDLDQEREDSKKGFENWRKSQETKMAQIEEQYNEVKALAEPKSYWQEKSKARCYFAWAFGSAFVALAILGGWGLLEVVKAHSRPELLKQLPADANQTMQTIFVIRDMIPGLVIAVGLLWALRLLARLFLVQVHLQADAAERVVMVQTYLAFLIGNCVTNGKSAVRPEDATLILTQLFRHESTGVFPDDSAPQIPILDLAKAVQTKPRGE
jgi:hypothetical protein